MVATARAVDLTNVKEGGNFRPRRKPEGDYRGKIVKVDDHLKEGKLPGWVLTIQVDGDARSSYPYYLNPEAKQAWKIRQVCVAAGINVKMARIKFDPNKLVGKPIGLSLEDDEYDGRPKSSIGEVFPIDQVSPSANEEAEEVEEDIDTDEEEYEEDEPEEEEEEEEPPAPAPKRRTRKPAPPPEPEEDDEEEGEDEPAPPPRRRRTTTPPTKKVAPARKQPVVPDDEDDDLDNLDTDDLDDE